MLYLEVEECSLEQGHMRCWIHILNFLGEKTTVDIYMVLSKAQGQLRVKLFLSFTLRGTLLFLEEWLS
jgi:hypothetical protein